MSRYFEDSGFCPALYEKWHLGYGAADRLNARGFDVFDSFHEWTIDYKSHDTRESVLSLYQSAMTIERDGYTSDILTHCAVDFID